VHTSSLGRRARRLPYHRIKPGVPGRGIKISRNSSPSRTSFSRRILAAFSRMSRSFSRTSLARWCARLTSAATSWSISKAVASL